LAQLLAGLVARLRPAAEGVLRIWPVSQAVTNVRNTGAALLDAIGAIVHLPSEQNLL